MPFFQLPRNVSAHRLAASSLYRALLHQCRSTQLPAPLAVHKDELQNIVRNRFKQTQYSHSYRRLKLAFQAGYEAVDHLDAAVAGDGRSAEVLLDLVQRAPAKVKAKPMLSGRSKQLGSERITHTGNVGEISSADRAQESALEHELTSRPRPLPALSGHRRVPVLYSANRIPVLRFKKPQPHALSRYVQSRIDQRQKRFDRRDWLFEQQGLARAEDEWDELVFSNSTSSGSGFGTKDGPGAMSLGQAMKAAPPPPPASGKNADREPRWTEEYNVALKVVEDAVEEEGRKNMEMARRMQDLVDREREAFEREREERRKVAREGRKERRRERRAAEHMAETRGEDVEE